MQGIWVKVRKFEEYKGRRDVKNNRWFRCENRLLEDPDFFSFSHSEILVWIQILALASQKNSDTIFISYPHFDRVCRLKKSVVLSAIEKLMGNQLLPVDVTDTYADVTRTCATLQTDITDKTNKTPHRAAPCPFDFDSLYAKYPRKEGKSQGFRILRREIKTPEDFSKLSAAIDRYRDHVTSTGTEARFIKHFSTFVNHWRDWLDPDTGRSLVGSGGFNWSEFDRTRAEELAQ